MPPASSARGGLPMTFSKQVSNKPHKITVFAETAYSLLTVLDTFSDVTPFLMSAKLLGANTFSDELNRRMPVPVVASTSIEAEEIFGDRD
jgi:hypothetical protein